MSEYVIMLLPDAEELATIKKALQDIIRNYEDGSPLVTVAWGILATIHEKERERRK